METSLIILVVGLTISVLGFIGCGLSMVKWVGTFGDWENDGTRYFQRFIMGMVVMAIGFLATWIGAFFGGYNLLLELLNRL